jgi:uncharacterized protein
MAELPDELARCSGFDWNAGNATKNWDLHQVTQAECEQAFFNRPVLVTVDEKHSGEERRYAALGQTKAGRRLSIVFTIRGTLVRVISARSMSRRERDSMSRFRKAPKPTQRCLKFLKAKRVPVCAGAFSSVRIRELSKGTKPAVSFP